MALSGYGNRPPLRYPCLLPLYHETALQAEARLRNTVEDWRRIDYVQPLVDDGPPKASINVRIKLKKLLDEGERLARIERNNKFLMKQIVKIMKGPGYVDHFHKNKLSAHSSTQTYLVRKLFVEQTNMENKMLLKRILHTKTSYDHIQQEMHYQGLFRPVPRARLFQKWDENSEKRRQRIMAGACKEPGYGDVDMDVMHERFVETHRHCVPSMEPGSAFQARPVPKSCASPEGVNHTDHLRCFSPVAYLPPIGRSRSPRTSGAGDVHVHETKAMRLRRTENIRKIKAMQPRPFPTRGRSHSPARNECKCGTQEDDIEAKKEIPIDAIKEKPIEAKEEPPKESLHENKEETLSRKESNVDTGEVIRKQSQGEDRKTSQENRKTSQGEGRKTSQIQGEDRKTSLGQGRKTSQSQGEDRKTSIGQDRKTSQSQGEHRKTSQSQGELRKTSQSQGESSKQSQSQGESSKQSQSQGESSKQSQSQGEDTKSSQEDRNQSKGEERKTSLGEGRKTSLGEGRKTSLGESRKTSLGEGRKTSLGEVRKTSLGEGRKQSQDEGRKTSQGEGSKQSQGEDSKQSQEEDKNQSIREERKNSQGEGRKQSLGENRKPSQEEGRKQSLGENRKTSQEEGRQPSQGGSQGEDQGENKGENKEEDNGESKEGDKGGNANVNQSAALKATRSMLEILAQNPYSMSVLQDKLIPLGPLPSATRGEGRCKEEKTPRKQACSEKDPKRQTENTMKPQSDEIKTPGRDEKLQNNTTDKLKKEIDSRPPGQKKEVRLKEQLGGKDVKLQTKGKYRKSTEKMEERMKAVASIFYPAGVSSPKSPMSHKLSAQAGLVAKKSKTEPSESFSGRREGSNDKESQSTAPRAEDEHVVVISTKGSKTVDSSPVGNAQVDSNASPEQTTGQKPSQENFFALALSSEYSPKAALSPKSAPSQSNSRSASATKDTPGGEALAQQVVSREEDLLGVGDIPREPSPEKKPTDAAPFKEGSARETCAERKTPKLASDQDQYAPCREGTSEMAVSPKDSSGHSSHGDYTSDACSSKKKSDESSAKLSSEKDATKQFSSQKDPSKMTSSNTSANNSARSPNRDSRTVDSPEKDTSGNHSVRSDGDSQSEASMGMVSSLNEPDLVQKEPPRSGSSFDSSSRSAPSKEYSEDFTSSQNDTCRTSAPDADSQEPLSSHEGPPRLSLPAKDASRQRSPEGHSSRLASRKNNSFGNSSSPQKKLPGSPSNDKASSKSASSRKKRPRSSTEEIMSPIPPPSLAPEHRRNSFRSQRRASRKEPVPQKGTEAGKDHHKSTASEGDDAKVSADKNTEEVIKEHSCTQEGNTSDDAEELPTSSVHDPPCLEQELSSSSEESWREGMYREP
ncbi:dentin sialophosphoprotein-like [Littorina saxatilis]|uniref:dentin sialophosphoprotein-like n=1 Tax=Littorina saxatilis TaxID=31220 RepID=UPI0038B56EF8